MTAETLYGLKKLNQLSLTEAEEKEILHFFDAAESAEKAFTDLDLSKTEIMVHLVDLKNVLRDDVKSQSFTREELQEGAPEKMDGYWQVPRLVE